MTARRLAPAALAAALALAVGACGEKREPLVGAATERVELALDRPPGAEHAGIYAARGAGDFATAGLDVKLRAPSDPEAALRLLRSGRADLAILHQAELLLARERGAELVAVGALLQRPLASIVSLRPRAVRRPVELEDRRVGISGAPHERAHLRAIMRAAGADPDRARAVELGAGLVPALLRGRVDAVLGMFWSVGVVELRDRDREPVVVRVEDVGVPPHHEGVVVARAADVRSRGALLRRFMAALARGHRRVRADVDAGVRPLVAKNPRLDRRLLRAQVRATLPAFLPTEAGRPFGFQDPGRWRRYAAWASRVELVADPRSAARAFTNEFLPGEGI